ncbi:hypothetical protein RxyAA322_04900 [Rubrobacter xylanophilus]|uniref:Uncharacterized protein n=1 Tax=Rubrobacter xylanophilus TaxID=49319 RepID=A0A510HFC8_9ACTN|nr:lysylphosphatidylglycerol synthase transmembrane domain-containing protein [Rubrobacter xylanophilus]BBL78636.1 hypothetical protein RxyAA322_04900 [Rubrobacter xylanophilus]
MKLLRALLVPAGLLALLGLALALRPEGLREAALYAARNPAGLLAALAAYTAAFGLRALAWRPLVPDGVRTFRLFSLLMAALFLNHATPAKAGDLARVYGLVRTGMGWTGAAASVALARLADLAGLLVVLGCFWPFAGGTRWDLLAVPAAVAALATLAILVFSRSRRLPLPGPLAAARRSLQEVRPRALLTVTGLAALAWVLEAGILVYVLRALGVEVSLAGAVAATCFAVLATAVPLAPGGLGTYEAGMVLVLAGLGVPAGTAFAAAAVSHALKYLYALGAAPFAAAEGAASLRERSKDGRRTGADEARVEV